MTAAEWTNWSGSLRFTPREIAKPRDDEELSAIIREAADRGGTVRVVGAGHSSSPLVKTGETLVSLEHFRGLVSHDSDSQRAVIRAGTTLEEAGEELFDAGLALHNLGDVNVQTVAGAVSTGTHGSGKRLKNLATALVGGRLVTGRGEIRDVSIESEPELLRAGRCSLGGIGIFTQLRLQLLPAYRLRRRELCASVDDTLAHLEQLAEENRNCDFYWYPRSDEVKIRTLNPEEEREPEIPFGRVVQASTGFSHAIISKKRELKFEEMEFAMPAEAGVKCFLEIRERVLKRHRKTVAWRVLYRFIAEDDAFLSTAHGRYTVTISLHHNAGLPFDPYFDDIEPIFRAYGGRPHWGKKHSMTANDLAPLYPKMSDYVRIRAKLDPEGVFLNEHLREILGVER
jgi:FAD/FMN-containing dehydrogenase